jgi:tRNA dimethylallyltransferase
MTFFLVGPTACGKHEASMLVAEQLGAEIVSVDSMKVYRGLDIGTAKPSKEDRARIPHHLIDIVDPEESYSAGRFVQDAKAVRAQVRLFSGGTFLYYKALVYGMFSGDAPATGLRDELNRLADERGTAVLHQELQRVDPEAAAKLHPNDRKRLIRALEVVRSTGRPISEMQTQWKEPPRVNAVAIVREREELRRRIEKRIDHMLEEGLVEEAKRLRSRTLSREVAQAIGYKECLDLLRGDLSRERAREEMIRRTWYFCRKQLTWIRSLKELKVLDITGLSDARTISNKILSALGQTPR